MPNPLTKAINTWFSKEKRDFPWRTFPSPYRVLVSEVMLQQTQAARVLDYFDMWMKRFPSLESLAKATEEEVMKAWEGLGYYSRARSLHKAARFFVQYHSGTIPQDKDILLNVPGIGPYTAGAILSFAFHQKEAAVDANVIRLFRRLNHISFSEKNILEVVSHHVQSLLPNKKPWHTMEAFIELGALVCQKKPKCFLCPVSSFCESFKNNSIELPPKKPSTTHLFRDVIVFISDSTTLVVKRTGKKIMSGLYEFPFFESSPGGRSSEEIKNLAQSYSTCSFQNRLANVTHSFTRFRASLYPWVIHASSQFSIQDGLWIPVEELSSLPFSSGHKKILFQIENFVHVVKDFTKRLYN